MKRVDVVLTNGKTDSAVLSDEDMGQMFEAFVESGLLIIGSTDDFATVYAKGSVFSFDVYNWEA